MVRWTKEQEEAIYAKGSDILVAAAAGSGKTAVLVERMIQKLLDPEDPADIDGLLVVTFTNAAAQEMRNRIGQALEQALEENPDSNHLKKQLSLLQRAPISTLHSFCLDVIRQYAYMLDIDPGFRIADEMEADLLKQDVLNDLFEEWYGGEGNEQESFFAVVDRFSGDRSDEEVEALILDLFTFAMQNPWPEKWLGQLAETYEIPENAGEEDVQWLRILTDELDEQFAAIEGAMKKAETIAREPDGPYQYLEAIEADLMNLQKARQLPNWEERQAFLAEFSFPALSRKKSECSEDKKEKVKKLRDTYKKQFEKLQKDWFSRSLDMHFKDMREMAPVVRQLAELVKQFAKRYEEEKRQRALVDFSDLEHYALAVLSETDEETGELQPSQAALQYKKKFKEVLIDEYQDVNLVQETIVSLISDREGAGNLFMVGDVKQSIYRFRHAEPGLFISKYKTFSLKKSAGRRIDLASNFRSRSDVLIGANYVFRQIMDEQLGEISYDKDAELIYANKTYDQAVCSDPEPELLIIDRSQDEKAAEAADEEGFEDLEKAQLEARVYADKIKHWLGAKGEKPFQVTDKSNGAQRDIQYRDIVILLRSMTWAPAIMDELKKQGIPVYADLSTGYFAAIEIQIMISLLKVIDNPRQDIPLASVLKSPIVGLNEEELARVRLADRKHAFYDAVQTYIRQERDDTADKLSMFLNKLKAFRLLAGQGALADLIWEIYRETGFYDFAGGMPGGRQRQANLRALYDRARGYEKTSFRGLFRFLRFIERMEERGDDLGAARALSEQEDVVRIMTIHKSKGLEFPVVIIGAMDKQFNTQELRMKYSLHKDLGFASKYIDPVKRISYPTLFYRAVNERKRKEMLAEEMRVLYVALTRAKEKLVMVGNVASFKKKQESWQHALEVDSWVLPAHERGKAKSYLDWVGPALIRHETGGALRSDDVTAANIPAAIEKDASRWKISIMHAREISADEQETAETDVDLKQHIKDWTLVTVKDTSSSQWVEERLSYEYPFRHAARSRAKQSVTEIKRRQEIQDEYAGDQIIKPFRAPIIQRPHFMQKEKKMTAAEKGTALHTFMQHLPFDKPLNLAEIEAFTEELVAREILEEHAAASLDLAAVEIFYKTDLAAFMIAAEKIEREIPFSLTLPAEEVYSSWTGSTENIFIQGIIDCAIPKEDGWVILDYKTDSIAGDVTDGLKEKLWRRYETQLTLYSRALEEIWQAPVKGAYLYFFDKQLLIQAPDIITSS